MMYLFSAFGVTFGVTFGVVVAALLLLPDAIYKWRQLADERRQRLAIDEVALLSAKKRADAEAEERHYRNLPLEASARIYDLVHMRRNSENTAVSGAKLGFEEEMGVALAGIDKEYPWLKGLQSYMDRCLPAKTTLSGPGSVEKAASTRMSAHHPEGKK